MKICKTVEFSAAHHLPFVHDGHKCGRLHGHNYKVDIILNGPILDTSYYGEGRGFVKDFRDIKTLWLGECGHLDHSNLNDHMKNPTSEYLAWYIFEKLAEVIPELWEITVHESDTAYAQCGRKEC